MAEANPDRGEDTITLAGVTYRLRPSHAAVRTIERKTERTTMELYSLGNRGAIPLSALGQIFGELIRAGADGDPTLQVNDERVEELIYEEGMHRAMARATLILISAASGGRKASGEATAVPGTTGTAGAN